MRSEATGSEDTEQKKKAGKRMRLLEVNKEAARYFYYMLRSPHGEVGMRYLTERKLTDETMHHFDWATAGKNGEQVVQYLRKKGFLPMKRSKIPDLRCSRNREDSEVSFGTG